MSNLDDYFRTEAAELRARFVTIQNRHKDTDVKGGKNERIVAEFLGSVMRDTAVTNSELIDVSGTRSDEIDVAICNAFQPFMSNESGLLLLAEGVNAVVQVKASLNKTEIRRIVSNCRTVKALQRSLPPNTEVAYKSQADKPHVVDRVMYIAFAFKSSITLKKAAEHLEAELASVPVEEQPEAIYVLDRGAIVNVRTNQGVFKFEPDDGQPFAASGNVNIIYHDTDEDALLMMVQALYTLAPRFSFPFHPLVQYWEDHIQH